MKNHVVTLAVTFILSPALSADAPKSLFDTWDARKITVQRDQGKLGTCHAFAIAPSLDFFENTHAPKGAKPFRVAENWLVFLSTLDRLCTTPASTQVLINQGGSAISDLYRAINVGYCSQDEYLDYDGSDTQLRAAARVPRLAGGPRRGLRQACLKRAPSPEADRRARRDPYRCGYG